MELMVRGAAALVLQESPLGVDADRGADPRGDPERTDDAKLKAELDKADICVTTEIHALLRHPSRGLRGCHRAR